MAGSKLFTDLKLRAGFGITMTYPHDLYRSLYRLQYTGTNNTLVLYQLESGLVPVEAATKTATVAELRLTESLPSLTDKIDLESSSKRKGFEPPRQLGQ